ncbi:sterile alpha motif domain-containing protein 3-like [Haliotis rubra]|uniref:sterile alpha motif domain-containing protein 3-like n=1 Tax=Haliotis rubra TaxID=36100 RepID=UPI001EE5B0B4|nr:sterile alpha motif domain-containing protein 3-like [Haliotis rubra]
MMAEVEFHITNVKRNGNNQKSIISFTLDQAENAISQHFDIPLGFQTQLYSDKYSDWVDISLNDPKLQGGGKLRVMSTRKAVDVSERGDNPLCTTAGPQEVPTVMNETPATCTCTIKTSVSTTNIQTSPWQSPYTLPAALPRGAVDVLDNGGFPNQGSRSHLLDSIYNDVSVKYTLYPLSYQYNEMIDAIFQRWPHLMTEDGLEGSSTRVLWRARIRDKFINNRRRKDSNVTCVQQRKRKSANKVVLEEPSPSKQPKMSLPVGEDDHSIHRHIQWMKQEARARKPDRSKISLLMKLTFSTRRKMVTSGGATVKEILDEYPWLANEDEVYMNST